MKYLNERFGVSIRNYKQQSEVKKVTFHLKALETHQSTSRSTLDSSEKNSATRFLTEYRQRGTSDNHSSIISKKFLYSLLKRRSEFTCFEKHNLEQYKFQEFLSNIKVILDSTLSQEFSYWRLSIPYQSSCLLESTFIKRFYSKTCFSTFRACECVCCCRMTSAQS